jgi:hypothetical protein
MPLKKRSDSAPPQCKHDLHLPLSADLGRKAPPLFPAFFLTSIISTMKRTMFAVKSADVDGNQHARRGWFSGSRDGPVTARSRHPKQNGFSGQNPIYGMLTPKVLTPKFQPERESFTDHVHCASFASSVSQIGWIEAHQPWALVHIRC